MFLKPIDTMNPITITFSTDNEWGSIMKKSRNVNLHVEQNVKYIKVNKVSSCMFHAYI